MSWEDLLKAKDDWKKKLKYGGKAIPKQSDLLINYIKEYPGKTFGEITRWTNRNFKSGMSGKRLRKFLEDHPNIQLSYTRPTTYSYRGE